MDIDIPVTQGLPIIRIMDTSSRFLRPSGRGCRAFKAVVRGRKYRGRFASYINCCLGESKFVLYRGSTRLAGIIQPIFNERSSFSRYEGLNPLPERHPYSYFPVQTILLPQQISRRLLLGENSITGLQRYMVFKLSMATSDCRK